MHFSAGPGAEANAVSPGCLEIPILCLHLALAAGVARGQWGPSAGLCVGQGWGWGGACVVHTPDTW